MTISPYQVDSVLRAYTKQMRAGGATLPKPQESVKERKDTVQLSSQDEKKEAYEKITYSLVDIILQNK